MEIGWRSHLHARLQVGKQRGEEVRRALADGDAEARGLLTSEDAPSLALEERREGVHIEAIASLDGDNGEVGRADEREPLGGGYKVLDLLGRLCELLGGGEVAGGARVDEGGPRHGHGRARARALQRRRRDDPKGERR